MAVTLFSAAGCTRCNITKNALRAKGLSFEEHDAVGGGRDVFAVFYRAHRAQVRRWADGIEFPVLVDRSAVRQGVAAAVAWVEAGERLDGFIGPNPPVKGWVAGIEVSGGDPGAIEDLVRVLTFLKSSGLKLEVQTQGRNPGVLARLLDAGLSDRVVMEVKGPPERYGDDPAPADVRRSMVLTARAADHRFETTVAPFIPVGEGATGVVYPTPEQVAATARWLAEATGSAKQPYRLRPFDPALCADERLRSIDPLAADALVRYRSAARRHQVLTEIEKPA